MEYYKNLSLEDIIYINDEGLVCWEQWKDTPNTEGKYQASSLGRIKSLKFKKKRILKSHFNGNGYLHLNCNGKTRKVHQLVVMAFLNHTPCGLKLVVNHKNFIRHDNRLENLEIISQRENTNHKHIEGSSKYTGVSWNKQSKKWVSSILVKGNTVWIGTFDDELEASEYYQNAVIAIDKGTEIQVKERITSSKHKGVCWDNSKNKWVAYVMIDRKNKYLGSFNDEEEALQYSDEALLAIKNGTEIKVKPTNYSSNYKGVMWVKSKNKWKAYTKIDGKSKHLGYAKTEEEAYQITLKNKKI